MCSPLHYVTNEDQKKKRSVSTINPVTKNYRKVSFTNVGKPSSCTVNQHLGLHRKETGHKGEKLLGCMHCMYYGMTKLRHLSGSSDV